MHDWLIELCKLCKTRSCQLNNQSCRSLSGSDWNSICRLSMFRKCTELSGNVYFTIQACSLIITNVHVTKHAYKGVHYISSIWRDSDALYRWRQVCLQVGAPVVKPVLVCKMMKHYWFKEFIIIPVSPCLITCKDVRQTLFTCTDSTYIIYACFCLRLFIEYLCVEYLLRTWQVITNYRNVPKLI